MHGFFLLDQRSWQTQSVLVTDQALIIWGLNPSRMALTFTVNRTIDTKYASSVNYAVTVNTTKPADAGDFARLWTRF